MKLVTSIEIEAPVQKVYEVFSDIKKLEERIEKIERVEIVSFKKDFVGTTWRETRTEFGKQDTIEMYVSDAKKNEYYEVKSSAHGTDYVSRYDFESVSQDVTKVTLTFEGIPKTIAAKAMSLLFFVFAGATKKLFMKDMIDLKEALEAS